MNWSKTNRQTVGIILLLIIIIIKKKKKLFVHLSTYIKIKLYITLYAIFPTFPVDRWHLPRSSPWVPLWRWCSLRGRPSSANCAGRHSVASDRRVPSVARASSVWGLESVTAFPADLVERWGPQTCGRYPPLQPSLPCSTDARCRWLRSKSRLSRVCRRMLWPSAIGRFEEIFWKLQTVFHANRSGMFIVWRFAKKWLLN